MSQVSKCDEIRKKRSCMSFSSSPHLFEMVIFKDNFHGEKGKKFFSRHANIHGSDMLKGTFVCLTIKTNLTWLKSQGRLLETF